MNLPLKRPFRYFGITISSISYELLTGTEFCLSNNVSFYNHFVLLINWDHLKKIEIQKEIVLKLLNVLLQNLVIVTTSIIAYVIPDVPRKLNDQMRQEAVITNNIILEAELRRARGEDPTLSESVLANIRSRAAGNQYNSGSGDFIRMSKAESHKEMDEVAVWMKRHGSHRLGSS